jgi:hypothetical protein
MLILRANNKHFFNCTDYFSLDGRVNDVLESMWKETVVANFKAFI